MMIALAFHVEKLHDERVWQRIDKVAKWMAHREMQATFFVYPFRAQIADKDISKQVKSIARRGHEIAQHTHFYSGTKINKPDKANDLSDANITYCLQRDFKTLQEMGFRPKGFTAGAWIVNKAVADILIQLGFIYDSSLLLSKVDRLANINDKQNNGSLKFYKNTNGRLLCLPSTCSLTEWFKWGWNLRSKYTLPYRLIYLHDYDLLSFGKYLLLWVILFLCRHMDFVSVKALAERFEEKAAHGQPGI